MLVLRYFSTLASLGLVLGRPLPAESPIVVRLEYGPKASGEVSDFYAHYAAQAANLLKSRLGKSNVIDLLKDEVDAGDKWWKNIIDQSDVNKPVVAFARIGAVVSPDVLNATSIAAWNSEYASIGYPSRLVQANPQHYLMDVSNSTTDPVRDSIEQTGKGPITRALAHISTEKKPFMKELPQFSSQSFSVLQLRDGTHLGDVQAGWRDTENGEGLEGEFDLYLPEKTPADIVEAGCEHLSIEVSNLIKFAYDDIVSGRWAYKPKTQKQ